VGYAVAVKMADSLVLAAPSLRELHTATRTPLTARIPWWLAALRSNGHGMPMLFTAGSRNGPLDAAGLLFRAGRRLTSPRPGSDDVWTIAARTPAALRNVAAQIADTATGLHLQITGLRDGDPAKLEKSDSRLAAAECSPARGLRARSRKVGVCLCGAVTGLVFLVALREPSEAVVASVFTDVAVYLPTYWQGWTRVVNAVRSRSRRGRRRAELALHERNTFSRRAQLRHSGVGYHLAHLHALERHRVGKPCPQMLGSSVRRIL
jgi:hypothetical protein